jgi:hypothetical protein
MPGHWNTVSVMMAKAISAAELQAGDGDHRHQGVLQRMAEVDHAVGQAAGAGELDVVGAQHLEHLGAHQAQDQRQLEQDSVIAGSTRCFQPSAVSRPVVQPRGHRRRGRSSAAT